jgi:hypothetical protein
VWLAEREGQVGRTAEQRAQVRKVFLKQGAPPQQKTGVLQRDSPLKERKVRSSESLEEQKPAAVSVGPKIVEVAEPLQGRRVSCSIGGPHSSASQKEKRKQE